MANRCSLLLNSSITCSLSDDKELQHKMHNMYIRTNTLRCRFGKCSKKVKARLFRITVYVCMALHCGILTQLTV